MKQGDAYRRLVARIDGPKREHVREILVTHEAPPKLRLHGKLGVWVWIVLLGADLAYEILGFADGPAGSPTLSQLVKGLRRAGGLAGTVTLALLLAVAYIALNLHWVAEVF